MDMASHTNMINLNVSACVVIHLTIFILISSSQDNLKKNREIMSDTFTKQIFIRFKRDLNQLKPTRE